MQTVPLNRSIVAFRERKLPRLEVDLHGDFFRVLPNAQQIKFVQKGRGITSFSQNKEQSTKKFRVPTAPGKPGKTRPDLENLEKQGVLGQKPGKILQNLEKIDLTPKKPKSLNRKSI